MADGGRVGIFTRVRGGGTTEIQNVTGKTEIGIPWLNWLSLMFFVPAGLALIWLGGWALWLYDDIQNSGNWRHWRMRLFSPWWNKGGWVLFGFTVGILGAFFATALTAYRLSVEQGIKNPPMYSQWDPRDGTWHPGKKVPLDQRRD